MSSVSRLRTLLIIATTCVCMATHAQTPDQERVKQLEKENDELRATVAQLRLELSQLKRELEQERSRTRPATDTIEQTPDAEGEASNPPVVVADQHDTPRTFRSADEIYRSIPQDMRPEKDGWDIQERRTVGDWLKTHITGKRFEARKEIKSVSVQYDAARSLWKVTISFEPEKMSYMSWDMKEQIYPVTLQGDKVFAENARKKYLVGNTVNVTGTITSIRWETFIIQKSEENWHPTYCELVLDAAQLR